MNLKIFNIIWKEISLVKSQKIALLLIILYPLLVVGLLGSAFTGIDVSKMSQSKIGLIDAISFDSNIAANFSSMKDLTIINYTDVNLLKLAVQKKEVIAGIRLSGESVNKPIKVELLYDNSSLLSSRFFVEVAKAMIQRVSSELVQKQLGLVWTTLSQLGGNIDQELTNVEDFKTKLAQSSATLDSLEAKLNAVDFSEMENTLEGQQNSVSSFQQKNETFKKNLDSFKISFNELKLEYSSFRTQVSQYKTQLSLIPGQITAAYTSLELTITQLKSVEPMVVDSAAKQKLNDSIALLEAQKIRLTEWNTLIVSLNTLLEKIDNNNSNLNKTITQADSLFKTLDSESVNVSNALSSSTTAINSANEKLIVFKQSIDEVKKLILDARKSKTEIESRLNESDSLLSTFSRKLVEFKDINPDVLAKPVIFYESRIFEVDSFGILVANSAVVVLILTCTLLTSLLIILEKTQKVSLRLSLSNTSKTVLTIGKILGQLVIALIEGAIIFLVAFTKIPLPFSVFGVKQIGFGLVVSSSIVELILGVIIISLSFIAIGMLISFFTKNQSTAILACLLLIVPMLFLSGIILPIEFMEPTMQLISSFLPLTVANNMLLGLIVKGVPLIQMPFEICYLLGITIIVAIATILQRD
jgi:ABC-type multidrug transport system permease subunit